MSATATLDRAKLDRIVADFPILAKPTSRGKRLVYLDSAASSQKPRAVIDALVHYYENDNANIHRGVYELAARATEAFEASRAKLARFVNAAESAEIIWTRNTTESINLVSFSWGLQNLGPGDAILTTQLEHHSNLVPWQLLAAKTGYATSRILAWANAADRMRIKGMGKGYSCLLRAVGVETIRELRYRNPANLAKAMGEANKKRKLVQFLPSEKLIMRWVKQAKELTPKITYR